LKEEGRRKKEEGRRKKEEGRGKKEEGRDSRNQVFCRDSGFEANIWVKNPVYGRAKTQETGFFAEIQGLRQISG
jgi:hypothetical protein